MDDSPGLASKVQQQSTQAATSSAEDLPAVTAVKLLTPDCSSWEAVELEQFAMKATTSILILFIWHNWVGSKACASKPQDTTAKFETVPNNAVRQRPSHKASSCCHRGSLSLAASGASNHDPGGVT